MLMRRGIMDSAVCSERDFIVENIFFKKKAIHKYDLMGKLYFLIYKG